MRPAALIAAALLAAPLAGAPRAARAQTVAAAPGTAYQTASLSAFQTLGTDMAGLRVTAHFADGASASAEWGDLGGGLSGAGTPLFRLTFPGDANTGSFDYGWRLANTSGAGLTRLVLSGAPGNTVFDVDGEEERTPNSALGIPLAFRPAYDPDQALELPSPYAAGSTVTYRNAVGVGGAAPLLDVFEQVDLLFGTAFAAGGEIEFNMDTDSVGDGGALAPADPGDGVPGAVVPEPSTVVLLGAGVLALAAGGRRRAAAG
jgi:hypothetical protein